MSIENEGSDSAPDTTPDTSADAPETGGEVETTEPTGDDEGYVPSDTQEETAALEPEAEQEVDAQPVAPATMSVALLSRALKAGLNEADIADAEGDPAVLEKMVRTAERFSGAGKEQNTSAKADSPGLSDVKKALSELEDLGDDVEPSLAKAVNTIKGMLQKVVDAQESAFGQLGGTLAQRDHAAAVDRFENSLPALPQAKELFGEGELDDLDPTSVQYANRTRLWKQMHDLREAERARGGKGSSYSALLKKAHQLAFGGSIKEQARRELSATVQSRSKQISAPPTQRRAPQSRNADPVELAKAKAREMERSWNK